MERQIFALGLHERKWNINTKAGELDLAVKFVRQRVGDPTASVSGDHHSRENKQTGDH
jgi:hypothetical protein